MSRFQIAETIRGNLLAINNPILKGTNYQDSYSGQDLYNESMKLSLLPATASLEIISPKRIATL